MKQKGQVELGAVPTLVITLVVIGLVIAIGVIVLQTMGDSNSFSPPGNTIQNISNIRTLIPYNLTATPVIGGSISYWNHTGLAMSSANYTVYARNNTVVFGTNCVFCNGSYAYASYSYDAPSAASNVTYQGVAGVATIADFQGVIAIVLVAAVILGLIGLIVFAARA